jgi:hypothetical protein
MGEFVNNTLGPMMQERPKCARAACPNTNAPCEHRMDHRFYCVACARIINKYNPMMPPLINIPEESSLLNLPPKNLPVLAKADPAAVEHQMKCNLFQSRIRKATFGITDREGIRTEDRHRIDAYQRHVSPQLANQGDSMLPTSIRRHVRDADRTASPTGIIYFHVGNAIVTYYEYVRGVDVAEALERRVALLEDLAKRGANNFRIIGSDAEGFMLMHKSEMPTPFLAAGVIEPDPQDENLR